MSFTISGEIDDNGSPFCDAYIIKPNSENTIQCRAIIDTGAYDLFLKQTVIDFLELEENSSGYVAHPIDGVIKSTIYEMDFAFGNLRFPTTCAKVLHNETYPADFIVGSIFLFRKHFKYDGIKKVWVIEW